eukprot:TRINITY_DN6447_c0_g1_i1.p1 TRINITY_DN6447_c0_g1~~TRINITY_DN6447_c0_g1_i1.p1  ORF type:complete len:192 (-),score=16.99 TRINITY_DN6447_c0_g1_i1:130-705(-)
MNALKAPFLAADVTSIFSDSPWTSNGHGGSPQIIDQEAIEADYAKQFKGPFQCPNWVNGTCIGFGVCLGIAAVVGYLIYYFGIRHDDIGTFHKEAIYVLIGCIVALLIACCCAACGLYCCIWRSSFWNKRKIKKMARRDVREMETLEVNRAQRAEEFAESRAFKASIRAKYGLNRQDDSISSDRSTIGRSL